LKTDRATIANATHLQPAVPYCAVYGVAIDSRDLRRLSYVYAISRHGAAICLSGHIQNLFDCLTTGRRASAVEE